MNQTDLWKTVRDSRLTENQALDIMQDAGAVSDLCLKLAEVADADCARAIEAILEHNRLQKFLKK